MAKKTNKLPENPVARIRMRLSDIRGAKVTQADFAEMLGVSEKYIGMLEAGSRNVSYKLGQKIQQVAPAGTRLQWILGEDDFETEQDFLNHEIAQAGERREKDIILEQEFMKRIAARAGFEFEEKAASWKDLIENEDIYFFTDKGGKTIGLPYCGELSVQNLWFDIYDYAAFRLKRTLEKRDIPNRVKIHFGDEKEEENG